MVKNNIQKEMDPIYKAFIEGPPKQKKVTNWIQLRDYLEQTGITPGEALRILKDKINNEERKEYHRQYYIMTKEKRKEKYLENKLKSMN